MEESVKKQIESEANGKLNSLNKKADLSLAEALVEYLDYQEKSIAFARTILEEKKKEIAEAGKPALEKADAKANVSLLGTYANFGLFEEEEA